ncbi:MAG: glycine cleavage system aminomethyltransferase GcvT [Candidatus Omnitrophica bacterium]|nr:glycine cleavage system aminomethyltransferase GcvT [Candidatus Omnitrophota bacterium]
MELKKTSLHQKHINAKGHIVNFSGWALPVEYTSTLKEAKAVRSACGLFDASHMGEIRIRGEQALSFLQAATPNDVSLIDVGQQQYSLFINSDGGIIDDLMIYRQEDSFLCVVNALNKDKVLLWLKQNNDRGVEILDESANTALICIQGPESSAIMNTCGCNLNNLKYMHSIYSDIDGKTIFVSRSGYTGEDGFEIYSSWDDAESIWDVLVKAGENFGLTLCGLGSRNILRIEAGYSLYGHEIGENVNPYEAGLGWVIKLDKDFIAKDKLIALKLSGTVKKKVGFVLLQGGVPRQGYEVYIEDRLIGKVLSGTYSPNVNKFIGMAMIDKEFASAGTSITLKIRDRLCGGKVVKLPFIESKVKREMP